MHPVPIDLTTKLELVRQLNQTGIKEIELTAFVRSDRVPQMADAADLVNSYERKPGIRYTALCLNPKGLELAQASKRLDNEGWIYFSASETFLKNNNNLTYAEFLHSLSKWAETFERLNVPLAGVMISNAFGCVYEGAIAPKIVIKKLDEVLNRLQSLGHCPTEISLADTVGLGHPSKVKQLVTICQSQFHSQSISLHLHDTRGLGLVNALAGLEQGVSIFECSVGGVGGCPFTKGAAGNIATEDFVYMCEGLGIETGIDLSQYCQVAKHLEALLGPSALSGRYYRSLHP